MATLSLPQKVEAALVISDIVPSLNEPSAWRLMVQLIGTEVATALGHGVGAGVVVLVGAGAGPWHSSIVSSAGPGEAVATPVALSPPLPQLSASAAETNASSGSITIHAWRGNIERSRMTAASGTVKD